MSCLDSPCLAYSAGPAGITFMNAVQQLIAAQCLITESWPTDSLDRVKDGDTFDFIIVGSGTAGSIVANRLTQINEWKVLLVEAGGDPPLESIIPNFSGATHHQEQVWQYFTEVDETTHRGSRDGRSFWPRGKMLGGTGAINGMLHMTGSPGDYEQWHFEKGDGWDWASVKKYFKKSEKVVDPFILDNPEFRKHYGTDGEFIIDQLNYTHPEIVDKLVKGYRELGLNWLDNINGESLMGVGKTRGAQHRGRRVTTATSFLNPIKDRNNLFLLKNTYANKIIIGEKDKRVTGIQVTLSTGSEATFYVSKEVIVSAGTINTPLLLMLSGVGPKEHLEEMDIQVIKDLRVGENLLDHVRISIPVTIDTGAKPKDENFWTNAAIEYLINQTGPYAINYNQPNINAFLSVPSDKELPDVQIDHNYFVPKTPYLYKTCTDILWLQDDICKQFEEFNSEQELLIFYISLCRPYSTGKILLRSTKPGDFPKIYSKYFSDQRDVDTYLKSLKKSLEILKTPTFKHMKAILQRIYFKDCDGYKFPSDEYWKCMLKTLTYNVYHPAGTAKMGKVSDPKAVVDSRLRVFGIKGLRVIDASIMPTLPSININAPVMMIAERGSDFIKDDYDVLNRRDEL